VKVAIVMACLEDITAAKVLNLSRPSVLGCGDGPTVRQDQRQSGASRRQVLQDDPFKKYGVE
jgi:hypothetical protein